MSRTTFSRYVSIFALLAFAAVVGFSCHSALAATQYFSDAGGPLTWGSASNWGNATGGPYTFGWTGYNDAIFEGTAGTVNVSSTQQANSLTFNLNGYVLSGGTIQIGNPTTPGMYVINGSTATINSFFNQSGSGNTVHIGKSGDAGTLVLAGNGSALSRAINLDYGILNLQNNAPFSTTGTLTVAATSTLQLQGGISVGAKPLTINGTGMTGQNGALVNVSGNNTYGGTITLGSASTFSSDGGSLTLNSATAMSGGFGLTLTGAGSGLITSNIATGVGGITKAGAGVWTLSGSDNFTGGTTISAGTLQVGNALALQNSTVSLSGGVLDLHSLAATLGALSGTGNLAISGANVNVGSDGASTAYSGNLSGAGGLIKTGSGAMVLTGTNTFGGTTSINNGTLQAASSSALPGYSTAGTVSVASGATLALNAGGANDWTSAGVNAVIANATLTAGSTLGIDTTNGNFNYGSNMPGNFTLSKLGTNTLTLSGTNTYSGGTTVAAGMLSVASISDSLASNISSGSVSLSGGTLQYTGATAASTTRSFALAASSGLDVSNGSLTISAPITGNNANALTKTGAGTLVLSGGSDNGSFLAAVQGGLLILGKNSSSTVHSIGGSTNSLTINGGTAQLGGTGGDQIFNSASVAVNGGVFDFNGQNESFNGLSGSGGLVTNSALSSTSTMTLGTNSGGSTYGGTIADGAGVMALVTGGTGSFSLTGSNNYSGGTTIAGSSSITITNSAALGAGPVTAGDAVGSGQNTALFLGNSVNFSNPLTLTSNASGRGYLNVNSGNTATYNGTITLNGAGTTGIRADGTLTVSGSIGGSPSGFQLRGAGTGIMQAAINLGVLNINKTDAGTWTISSTGNTWGNTSVTQGILALGASGALPASSQINLGQSSSAGTLNLAGFSQTIGGLSSAGSLTSMVTTTSGASTLTINDSLAFAYTGSITGALSLVQSGNGSETLSGTANSYTGGTSVEGGLLKITSSAALGATSGGLTVDSGTLDLGGVSPKVGTLSGLAGTITNSGSAVSLLTTSFTGSSVYSGSLVDGTSAVGLIKAGAGTLLLSGTNNFSGGAAVSGGVLAFASTSALPNGAGSVTVASSGALAVSGAYTTVTGWLGSNSIAGSSAGVLALVGDSSENISIPAGYPSLGLGATGSANYSGTLVPAVSTYYLGGAGGTLTVSSSLSSGTALVVAGNGTPGTVVLANTGNNAFSGGVTIASGGTLQASTDTLQGAVSSSGALVLNQTDSGSLGGALSGPGSLTLNGSGTLLMAPVSAFSGSITVNGGTLNYGNFGAGATSLITANSGATVNLVTGNALGSSPWVPVTVNAGGLVTETLSNNHVQINKVTLNGGTLDSGGNTGDAYGSYWWRVSGGTLAATANSTISALNITADGAIPVSVSPGSTLTLSGNLIASASAGAGGLTLTGGGKLLMTNTNTYTGLTTITGGTLQLGSGVAGQDGMLNSTNNIVNNSALVYDVVGAQTYSGSNTGTGALAMIGSGVVTLSGTGVKYSGATTVSGGTLTLQDTTNNTTATFASAITLSGNGALNSVRSTAGTAARGPLFGNAGVSGSGVININNTAGGAPNSMGWTTIGVANGLTMAGTINVNTGGFARDNTTANNINTTATVNVASGAIFAGGRGGNSTIGALNGTGDVGTYWSGTNAGSITLGNGGGSGSFAGIIHGNGTVSTDFNAEGGVTSLIKIGSGTQILAGVNTYSGTTTITGGTLQLGTGLANQDGSINSTNKVVDNNVLAYDIAGTQTAPYAITGSGSVASVGPGYVSLTGTNTFTGGTTISGGTLAPAGPYSLPGYSTTGVSVNAGGTLYIFGGGVSAWSNSQVAAIPVSTFNTGATFAVDTTNGNVTYAGNLSGGMNLAKLGFNTLVLSGSESYTGTTTISGGTVQVTNATLPGAIVGSGALVTTGGGTTLLSGSSTFTGGTTVSNGETLLVSFSFAGAPAANILPAGGNMTLGGGSMLQFVGSNGATNSQSLGNLSFTAGPSLINLAPNGAAALTVTAGSLWSRSAGATVDFTGLGASAGTLTASPTTTASGVIIGAGSTAFATVNGGSDWASVVGGNIAALPAGSYTATTWASGNNTDVTSASTNPGSGSTTSTLRFNSAGAKAYTLAGLNTLQNGGILMTAANGGTVSISGGSLTSSSNDIVIHQYNGNLLTIGTLLENNGANATAFTKTGSGTVYLTGANTFTGNAYINGGIVRLGSSTALGVTSSAATRVTVAAGATLDVAGTSNTSYGITIAGNGSSGQGAIINSGAATNSGNVQTPVIALSANASIGGTGNWYEIAGGYAADTLTLNNFTLTKTGSNTFFLANTTVSAGTINITSGTISQFHTPGDMSAADLVFANSAGAALNLSGSAFAVGSLSGGGSTGGNVIAGALFTVGNDNNSPGAYAGQISGGGGLTKVGTGTLLLTGSNTYTGATTVSGGTLALSGSGSINSTPTITLSPGTVFDLSGLTSTFTLGAAQSLTGGRTASPAVDINGSIVSSGSLNDGAGTLTVAGSVSLNNGSKLIANLAMLSGGSGGVVNMAGASPALTLSGTTTVVPTNPFNITNGTYTLINGYSSVTGGTGNLALAVANSGTMRGTLASSFGTTASSVNVTISGLAPATLTWTGTGGNSNWDVNTTSNWINASGGTADKFFNNDTVTLNDTSSNTTVSVTGAVYPAAVTVSTTGTYNLTGTGSIGGLASLTKSGTGTLNLLTNNSFTGRTIINAGTVSAGTGSTTGSIGTGLVQIASGATFTTNRSDNITLANSFSGAGTFYQNGATVTLSGSSTAFTGTAQLANGATLTVPSGASLTGVGTIAQDSASSVTWNVNGTLGVSTANLSPGGGNSQSSTVTVNVNAGGAMTASTMNLSYFGYADYGSSTSNVNVYGVLTVSNLLGWTPSGSAYSDTLNRYVNVYPGGQLNATTIDLYGYTGAIGGMVYNRKLTLSGGTLANIAGTNLTVDSSTVVSLATGTTSTLSVPSPYSMTISGTVSGAGSLTTVSNGLYILAGSSNTYTGTTNINAGTLQVGTGGTATTFASSSVTDNGALVFNQANSFTYSGAINGIGSLTKTGSGILALTGSMTYAGVTTINGGVLDVSSGIPSGNLVLNNGIYQSKGTLARDLGTGSNQVQWISGATGGFSARGGTLTVGQFTTDPAVWGSTPYFVSSGQAVTFGSSTSDSPVFFQPDVSLNGATQTVSVTAGVGGDYTQFTGNVTGTGTAGFTKSGNGTLVLSGSNVYGGNTSIAGGILRITTSASLPSNTVAFTATSGTLDVTNVAQTVANLTFADNANVGISGAGGSLTVSPASLNLTPTTTAATSLTVNMSNLSSFTYNNVTGSVVCGQVGGGSLAAAVSVTLAGGTDSITAANLHIGDSGTSNNVPASTLNLGASSTLSVNTIGVGASGGRSQGTLQFAPGLVNPVMTITGTGGAGTTANLTIGKHDSFQHSDTATDTFDSTAGTLYAQLGNVTIGQETPGVTSGTRGMTINASMNMAAGSLSANSMTIALFSSGGSSSGNYNLSDSGSFAINGGTADITTLTLANNGYVYGIAGSNNTLNAQVTLNGGANLYATTIQQGTIASVSSGSLNVVSQVNWNSGTLGNLPGSNLNVSGVSLVTSSSSATNAFNISAGQTGTVSSVITGPGAISSVGPGMLIVAASNGYSGGTIITAGLLQLGNSAALGSGALAANGGTLDLAGYGIAVSSFSGAAGIVTNSGSSLATFTVNQSNATSFNGAIKDGAAPVALSLTGSGALVLGGNSSYSGSTTVTGGTLRMGTANALPYGAAAGSVTVSGLGTLDLAGRTTNINGLWGSGTIDNSSGTSTLVVGNNNASSTFAGILMNSGGTAAPLGLTKVGAGTFALGASNSYSGLTTVQAGDLDLGAAGALSGQVLVTAGTLDASGFAQSIQSLTMAGGALVLSPLTLASNGSASFGGTLNITGDSGAATLMTYSADAGAFSNVLGMPSGFHLSYGTSSLSVVATITGPPAWQFATSGSWNDTGKWNTGSVPNGIGQQAAINAATGTPLTITLDSPQTLGALTFANSNNNTNGYTLATGAAGSLTLDNSGATSQIVVNGGNHAITAPVYLVGGDLEVSASGSGILTIGGSMSQDTLRNLTVDGDGTGELVLNPGAPGNNLGGAGATATVSAGTLIVNNIGALADGTSLTVGDASFFSGIQPAGGAESAVNSRGPAVALSLAPVPEPGTLMLAAAGAVLLLTISRERAARRRKTRLATALPDAARRW